jgi:tetratricopeptide (TPR) repeat protein
VRAAGPADADAFAALEEQRDFLLGSLDDLEREHEAGDVDDVDYRVLKSDYTARAAAVLRAIEDGEVRFAQARPQRSWTRLVGVIAIVALVAIGAGVLLARASGTRGGNDQISGDIRLTNRDRLLQAQDQLAGEDPDPVAALELFDEVLTTDPDNVEALTYRGWTLALSGLTAEGLTWLDRAVAADPGYPDARALRAVVLANGMNRPADALADLEALDPATTPPDIAALIDPLRARLEAEIAAGAVDAEDVPGPSEP